MPSSIDLHQHLWPPPLLQALSARREPPRLTRHRTGWTLRAPGEAEAPIDLRDHDPVRRAELVHADGLDLALIAPSTPIGIESLAPAEAETLLEAYHEGVGALPQEFGAWAAVSLAEPDPQALKRRLEAGFVGACVPADALSSAVGYERLGPVLETLERHARPLFIHPGPPRAPAAAGAPSWWSALTDYVASMQAAWHAMALWGRRAHPDLRVCFAMLAGLAPLQGERLASRGGPTRSDPGLFLDTSSYGTRAIDAVIRELGADRLVYGSDRPVIPAAEPALGDAVRCALRGRNAKLLLSPSIDAREVCA
jgi:6-methylsalicylate decarboxylase